MAGFHKVKRLGEVPAQEKILPTKQSQKRTQEAKALRLDTGNSTLWGLTRNQIRCNSKNYARVLAFLDLGVLLQNLKASQLHSQIT
jgi:hypothetical protein